MSTLARAIEIAASAFVNKTDRSGQPYILHCLWVMNKVRFLGHKYMIAAVLHDLLEDTMWTREQLINEGFDPEVIEAIWVLTHKPADSYEIYIERIGRNKIATAIKLRDLEHNSKITRLKGLREKDLIRTKKYHQAYIYLKSIDHGINC